METIDRLFVDMPWFRHVLSWSIAMLILWAVFTFPAYLILPIVNTLRARLTQAFGNLRAAMAIDIAHQADGRKGIYEELSKDQQFRTSSSEARSLLRRAVLEVRGPLVGLRDQQRPLIRALESVPGRLSALDLSLLGPVLSLKNSDVLPEHTSRAAVAKVQLWVGLSLLLIALLVNTGMLSQIIRDLDIFPTDLAYAGVHLTLVFALVITVVEAGVGYMFGVLGQDEDGNQQLTISASLCLAGALMLAFVEGFFYSRIGESSPGVGRLEFQVPIPGVDIRMSYEAVFFLWGFVLVMSLFGFGVITHRASDAVVRLRTVRLFRRFLKSAADAAQHWQTQLQDTQSTIANALQHASNARDVYKATEAGLEAVSLRVDQVISVQTSLSVTTRPLLSGEIRQRQYQAVFWCILAALTAVMVVSATRTPLVGLAITAGCLAAGVFLRQRVVDFDSLVVIRPRLFSVVTIVIVAAILAATLATLSWGTPTLALAVLLGLVVAVSAGEASVSLPFLRIIFLGLGVGARRGFWSGTILFVGSARLIAAMVSYLLAVIAAPATVVMQRRATTA